MIFAFGDTSLTFIAAGVAEQDKLRLLRTLTIPKTYEPTSPKAQRL